MSDHTRILTIVITLVAAAAGFALVALAGAVDQHTHPHATLRVGTFDSRAVALAYWRSEAGEARLQAMHDAHREARAAGDEARVKELEKKGPGLQVRMHQQVFSTGSVTDLMGLMKDDLPGIAGRHRVTLIVPSWQIAWAGEDVETVDVTDELVGLFDPDDAILKMVAQMRAQEPVPIDELSMDPNH